MRVSVVPKVKHEDGVKVLVRLIDSLAICSHFEEAKKGVSGTGADSRVVDQQLAYMDFSS